MKQRPEDFPRALTVRAPWAWAMLEVERVQRRLGLDVCPKRVENRKGALYEWAAGLDVLLHAAAAAPARAEVAEVARRVAPLAGLSDAHVDIDAMHAMRGQVVGVVRFIGCWVERPAAAATSRPLRRAWDRWRMPEAGKHAWLMADVRRLHTQRPATGQLGLWRVPPDLHAAVMDDLERGAFDQCAPAPWEG